MKKLYRSTTNSYMSGLCGGIGEMLNIDPTIIRILFVVLAFCSFGTMLLIYIVASMIVPKSPYSNIHHNNHFHY
ncbi:PspC domain-containing protein [Paenibacillus septentrionalis]|uniref:PspC domain-containing protein n=1 Tax=Paenibacillus septentrionalis TaxID=429342 RepID=A0ABW1V3T6_9BACL